MRASIIIPIYNKAPQLKAALDSVLANKLDDKEVILVDDASEDGSAEIAARYARKHGWQFIRHETNQGVSVARNNGLDVARGTYIQLWDADDLLHPEGLARILPEMEEDGADVATGVAFRDGDVHRSYGVARKSVRATTLAETPEAAANDSSCFKIYRRAFLDAWGIRFVPRLWMQDVELNLRAMPVAERITMTPYRMGDYVNVPGSNSSRFSPSRFQSTFDADAHSRAFYREHALDAFEPFRQERVLMSIYRPFVRHALTMITRGYRDPESGPDLHVDRPAIAFAYLERFRAAVADLSDGIRRLVETEPGTALGFACLVEGAYAPVLPLLRGAEPGALARDHLPHSRVLSAEQVEACLAVLNPVRDDLQWPTGWGETARRSA